MSGLIKKFTGLQGKVQPAFHQLVNRELMNYVNSSPLPQPIPTRTNSNNSHIAHNSHYQPACYVQP